MFSCFIKHTEYTYTLFIIRAYIDPVKSIGAVYLSEKAQRKRRSAKWKTRDKIEEKKKEQPRDTVNEKYESTQPYRT